MILVIDAYNVLKQALETRQVADAQKQRFIGQLGLYGKRKDHAIIAVFDGGPYEWPDKERMQGVMVVHSGIHESADDWIKKYVAQHKSYDILVVSTDRELGAFVHRAGIQTLDAHHFYGLLCEALAHKQPHAQSSDVVKITEAENPEVDQLMLESLGKVPVKVEDVTNKRESKAQTLSKQERKIAQKIKKL
jgi:predicted RNA-binding protein with PIN domain